MSRRHLPDLNDVARVAFAAWVAVSAWRRRKRDQPKILPFAQGSLLEQGQQQAGELAAKVTTDGDQVDGELSVTAGGDSWAAKLWARVTAHRAVKPEVSAGIEFQKRWFGGW